MSESFHVELGSPLPLSIQMPAGASGLFPRARIYDSSDVEVAGSPFDLTEVGATARYTGASFTPLAVGSFTARFVAFTDAGHTTEAVRFSRDQDSYVVAPVHETEAAAAIRQTALIAEHDATQATLATLPADVDTTLSASHGGGSWVGISSSDWTTGELEQIRFRLSLDGTQTDPTTDLGDFETALTRFGIGNAETEYEDATSTTPGSIKSPPVTGTRLNRTVTQTAANKVKVGV